MYESFYDAKVGDKVILHVTSSISVIKTSKQIITRITKKHVVLHMIFNQDGKIYNEYDNLYRKDNGQLRGIGLWSTNYITHPIEENINETTKSK